MDLESKRILVKLEGGLGDCLLGNRFLPAIKEKHPGCIIDCGFENNRGEIFQLDVLSYFYKNFYNNFYIFKENLKNNYDFFYNLHIDKMHWTNYDFDWLSRFYFFPKPEIPIKKENFVCLHLTHNKWEPKNLKTEYITELVEKILEIHPNIVAICTNSEREKYEHVKNKIKIINTDIISACKIVASSKAFITIDSGFKYIAYAYGVPTIETADYYLKPGFAHPMIKSRWLPFCERGLPLYCETELFQKALKNILKNKIASLSQLENNITLSFKL